MGKLREPEGNPRESEDSTKKPEGNLRESEGNAEESEGSRCELEGEAPFPLLGDTSPSCAAKFRIPQDAAAMIPETILGDPYASSLVAQAALQ
jgi:hypothetical protein